MRGLRITLLMALILCGCSQPAPIPTHEQWTGMTQRRFEMARADEIIDVARKVLTFDNRRNLKFDTESNGFIARRGYQIYMTGTAPFEYFIFEVTAIQDNDDVRARLVISTSSSPAPRRYTFDEGDYWTLPQDWHDDVQSRWPYHEAYDLFFARMAALLKRGTWPLCAEVSDVSSRPYEPLCLFSDDNVPPDVSLTPRGEAILRGKMGLKP